MRSKQEIGAGPLPQKSDAPNPTFLPTGDADPYECTFPSRQIERMIDFVAPLAEEYLHVCAHPLNTKNLKDTLIDGASLMSALGSSHLAARRVRELKMRKLVPPRSYDEENIGSFPSIDNPLMDAFRTGFPRLSLGSPWLRRVGKNYHIRRRVPISRWIPYEEILLPETFFCATRRSPPWMKALGRPVQELRQNETQTEHCREKSESLAT